MDPTPGPSSVTPDMDPDIELVPQPIVGVFETIEVTDEESSRDSQEELASFIEKAKEVLIQSSTHSTLETQDNLSERLAEDEDDSPLKKRMKLCDDVIVCEPTDALPNISSANLSINKKLNDMLEKAVEKLSTSLMKQKIPSKKTSSSVSSVINNERMTFRIPKDEYLPKNINFFLTNEDKHDCFFLVGQDKDSQVRIGAVKIMLSAISEPLRNMLEESKLREKGDIELCDTDRDTFINFLKCVYGGHSIILGRITFEACCKLLNLFEKYLVQELKSRLVKVIVSSLQATTKVFTALSHLIWLYSDKIDNILKKMILVNSDLIIESKEFLSLPPAAVGYIIKTPFLPVSEVYLWKVVLKWAEHNYGSSKGPELRNHMAEFLKFIKFCSMSPEEFLYSVVPTNVLRDDEVLQICKAFGSMTAPNLQDICNDILPRYVDNKSSFAFTVKVNDAKSSNHTSYPFRHKDLVWTIKVNKTRRLSIALEYDQKSTPMHEWERYYKINFCLVSQLDNKSNYYKRVETRFSRTSTSFILANFMHWNDLVDPLAGFIKNDTFTVLLSFD